jgi:hypothetical protein
MSSLIDELYSKKDCEHIKKLFLEDISVREHIKKAIGEKIVLEKDKKILVSNSLDILYLVCLTSEFASSDEECHRIAITIHQHIKSTDEPVLPYLHLDFGLVFASKTLLALSFWAKALEHRWKFHGAPSPKYYREISKHIFNTHGQKDISNHHEQWEGFIGELFV